MSVIELGEVLLLMWSVAQKSRDTFRDGTILEYLTYLHTLEKKRDTYQRERHQIQISLFQAAEGVKKFAEEFL